MYGVFLVHEQYSQLHTISNHMFQVGPERTRKVSIWQFLISCSAQDAPLFPRSNILPGLFQGGQIFDQVQFGGGQLFIRIQSNLYGSFSLVVQPRMPPCFRGQIFYLAYFGEVKYLTPFNLGEVKYSSEYNPIYKAVSR